jgi:hypothetical protein
MGAWWHGCFWAKPWVGTTPWVLHSFCLGFIWLRKKSQQTPKSRHDLNLRIKTASRRRLFEKASFKIYAIRNAFP